MNPETALQQNLYEIGISAVLDKEKNHVEMNLSRIAGLKLLNNYEFFRREFEDMHINPSTLRKMDDLRTEESSFYGECVQNLEAEMNGDIDLKPYEDKYQKFQETGLIRRLKTVGALGKPRRKRRMDEYDGDWDWDRKWELKPYQKTERKKQLLKTVKVIANFACSGMTSTNAIQKYGSLVWALCKVIEDAGIQTEIYYREVGRDVGHNGTNVTTMMLLKKPGEYISPQALAAAFTPHHYRRLGFIIQALGVSVNGNDGCDHSMGKADPQPAIKFAKGVLTLDVKSHNLEYEVVEKEILKVIGGKETK